MLHVKIDMNVGLSGPLDFDEDTILRSCIFYWGEYNPNYPLDDQGLYCEGHNKQLEFRDIPVREINWVINELRKLNLDK